MSHGHLAQKAKLAGEKPPARSLRSRRKNTTTMNTEDPASTATKTLPVSANISSKTLKPNQPTKQHGSRIAASAAKKGPSTERKDTQHLVGTASEDRDTASMNQKPPHTITFKVPKHLADVPKKTAPQNPTLKSTETVKSTVKAATEPRNATERTAEALPAPSMWASATSKHLEITGNPTVWTAGVPTIVDMNTLMWFAEKKEATNKKAVAKEATPAVMLSDTAYCSGMSWRNDWRRTVEVKLYKTVAWSKFPRLGACVAPPTPLTCGTNVSATGLELKTVDSSLSYLALSKDLSAATEKIRNITTDKEDTEANTDRNRGTDKGGAEQGEDHHHIDEKDEGESGANDTVASDAEEGGPIADNRRLGGIRTLIGIPSISDRATLHSTALCCTSPTREVGVFDSNGWRPLTPRSHALSAAGERETVGKKRVRGDEDAEKEGGRKIRKVKVADGVKQVLRRIDMVVEVHWAEKKANK